MVLDALRKVDETNALNCVQVARRVEPTNPRYTNAESTEAHAYSNVLRYYFRKGKIKRKQGKLGAFYYWRT